MLVLEYVKWWYGRGWAEVMTHAKEHLLALADMFSISILLRTLFAPWKRIISYPGAGLEARLRAALDNLVSRAVGFVVRILVLVSAGIALVLLSVISLAVIVAWPWIPFAAIALIVWGVL